MRPGLFRFMLLLILAGAITACSPSLAPVPATETQQPVTTQSQQPILEPTVEPSATHSLEITMQPTPVFTPGLECSMLQDVNLRKGPGVAYAPPILVLHEKAVVIPLGYAPKGIPRESWVMVLDPSSQQVGWVNAAEKYVTCNSDVTILPQVTVEPPPPPKLPSAQSSSVEGTCGAGGIQGNNGNIFDCAVKLTEEGGLPLQFIVIKDGQEIGKSEGVEKVDYKITKDGKEVYSRTETNKDYCLFGGDGPCNSWTLENYVYKWEPGGAAVEEGNYEVSIDATLNNEPDVVLHWDAVLKIKLPQ